MREADRLAILQWLESFAAIVRSADYQRGRELFAQDVFAFGTQSSIMSQLDQLVYEQWQPIWKSTRGFMFDMLQMQHGIDGDTAWVAVPWHSQGHHPSTGWFDRHGRATYILQRRGDRWLAIHSHHSLKP